MDERTSELVAFMDAYERATNSHDVAQLAPLIAPEAVYWFTDGSHRGTDSPDRDTGEERTFWSATAIRGRCSTSI